MKYTTLLSAFLAFVTSTTPVFGITDVAREFNQLREQRDKALAAVADPINRRYKEDLEQLLRRATQSNDLETALKIKEALGLPVEPHAERDDAARLLTDYHWAIKSDKFEFRADGKLVQLGAGWIAKRWKLARDGRSVEVEFEKNPPEKWTITNGVLTHCSLGAFQRVDKPAGRAK